MAFPNPESIGQDLVEKGKSAVLDAFSATDVGRTLRSRNLLPGAEPQGYNFVSGVWNPEETIDWRVKLSLPRSGAWKESVRNSGNVDLLAPIEETDGMVWPYTPNIFITHSANYDKISPVHTNYPFPVYQSSQVEQMNITGEFTVENANEGLYWLAAMHFLRSVTKMSYGESSNPGSPPPVLKLNGYGDFVFRDVPVVVEQFNYQLAPDVDYIKVDIGKGNGSWVPTQSEISVGVSTAYSRDSVNKFSLDKFVKGDYILGDGPGFI